MRSNSALWALCTPLVVGSDVLVQKRQSSVVAASSSASSPSFVAPTAAPSITVNSSNHDLSQHFCRIWRHQSVYADGKIYVDGGNTYVPDDNYTYNNMPANQYEQGMNDVLLVIDLSKNFTNQDTAPYSVIDKGPQVPNAIIEGTLWYSQVTRKIYQLGGWFSFNSNTDPGFLQLPQIPKSSIWEFDIDKETWAQSAFNLINTGTKVNRPGAAANCDAPTLNMSFIFEGYVQQRSDAEYINFTQSSTFQFLEGMLSLDTNTSPATLTNVSVPDYIGARMNGALVHVPVGPKGVLVNIAGQTTLDSRTQFGVPIINANAGNVNINNTFVDLYDVETGFWFRQTTYGTTTDGMPSPRSDICTVMVPAPDGSSYNIYVVAGIQTYNGVVAYEDIWVLSIPSFMWVKVHSRPGGIWGHTCHAVGENLVIVGGMQTVYSSSGTSSNVNNCSSHMPAEIFSLVELEYTGIFDAAGASRTPPVPSGVVAAIGGTSTGAAYIRQPQQWSDAYLAAVFNPSLVRPSYTPTYALAGPSITSTSTATSTNTSGPAPKSTTSNVGAIAGGVVGGIVVLALLFTGIFICLKNRKSSKPTMSAPILHADAELPTYQDSKDANAHAIEVSSHQSPLVFAPYQPYAGQRPAEMDGNVNGDEESDQWRPLSTATSPVIVARKPVAGGDSFATSGRSPEMGVRSPSRVSEVSAGSAGSPIVTNSEMGRVSRQSEVSANE